MSLYNLTAEEQKEVDEIEQRVADRMVQLSTLKYQQRILAEAFVLIADLGEIELANRLLDASKRIGEKLKTGDNAKTLPKEG